MCPSFYTTCFEDVTTEPHVVGSNKVLIKHYFIRVFEEFKEQLIQYKFSPLSHLALLLLFIMDVLNSQTSTT